MAGTVLAAQNVCASRFRDRGNLPDQFRGNAQFGQCATQMLDYGVEVAVIEASRNKVRMSAAHVLA